MSNMGNLLQNLPGNAHNTALCAERVKVDNTISHHFLIQRATSRPWCWLARDSSAAQSDSIHLVLAVITTEKNGQGELNVQNTIRKFDC